MYSRGYERTVSLFQTSLDLVDCDYAILFKLCPSMIFFLPAICPRKTMSLNEDEFHHYLDNLGRHEILAKSILSNVLKNDNGCGIKDLLHYINKGLVEPIVMAEKLHFLKILLLAIETWMGMNGDKIGDCRTSLGPKDPVVALLMDILREHIAYNLSRDALWFSIPSEGIDPKKVYLISLRIIKCIIRCCVSSEVLIERIDVFTQMTNDLAVRAVRGDMATVVLLMQRVKAVASKQLFSKYDLIFRNAFDIAAADLARSKQRFPYIILNCLEEQLDGVVMKCRDGAAVSYLRAVCYYGFLSPSSSRLGTQDLAKLVDLMIECFLEFGNDEAVQSSESLRPCVRGIEALCYRAICFSAPLDSRAWPHIQATSLLRDLLNQNQRARTIAFLASKRMFIRWLLQGFSNYMRSGFWWDESLGLMVKVFIPSIATDLENQSGCTDPSCHSSFNSLLSAVKLYCAIKARDRYAPAVLIPILRSYNLVSSWKSCDVWFKLCLKLFSKGIHKCNQQRKQLLVYIFSLVIKLWLKRADAYGLVSSGNELWAIVTSYLFDFPAIREFSFNSLIPCAREIIIGSATRTAQATQFGFIDCINQLMRSRKQLGLSEDQEKLLLSLQTESNELQIVPTHQKCMEPTEDCDKRYMESIFESEITRYYTHG